MNVTLVGFAGADFKFSMYAPSTVAAACVRLAVAGVFGDSWCATHRLDRRLRRFTRTDPVNTTVNHLYKTILVFHVSFSGIGFGL